jgi:hypothetical protein
MRSVSKLVAAVLLLGIPCMAAAKGSSLDDMFANANASASTTHEAPTRAGAKRGARHRTATVRTAPNRASKSSDAPVAAMPSAPPAATSPSAPPVAPAEPAPGSAKADGMVLEGYAPDRHALVGP